MARFAGWIAFTLALLASSRVWASNPYGVVTVELRAGAEVPTHLCVVSAEQGPRTRFGLGDLLQPGSSGDQVLDLAKIRRLTDLASVAASASTDLGRDAQMLDAGRCESGDGACAPSVRVPGGGNGPADLWAACTYDEVALAEAGRRARVVVLMIDHLQGSPPRVESLNLAGGVATIGVGADLRRGTITVRALGGHYRATARGVRADASGADAALAVLALESRCAGVIVEARGSALGERQRASLRLVVDGRSLDAAACVGALSGEARFQATLPRAGPGGAIVELALVDREGKEELRWSGRLDAADAATLLLHPEVLTFSWRVPPCVMAPDECPTAQLEGGIACEAARSEDMCAYTCRSDEMAGGLVTPVTVDLSRGTPKRHWSVILARPRQVLEGELPPDQIWLEIDTSMWAKSTPGSRIQQIEIRGEDGSARRYAIDRQPSVRVLVPNASCQPVRYQVMGDRSYEIASAPVVDGRVAIVDPARGGRVVSFGIILLQGGGPAFLVGGLDGLRQPVHFSGLLQAAVGFRPRRGRAARLAGELRLGGTLGQWGYFGQAFANEDPRPGRPKVIWSRFLVEPALVVDLTPVVGLSVGVGFGSAWAPRTDDFYATSRYHFIVSPNADLRFRVRRWLDFIAQTRVVAGEHVVLEHPQGDGSLARSQRETVSLIGLYGVQFKF